MICTVYWGRSGLILVPDCLIPSREAELTYGPLRRCGSFDTEGLSPDLTARIIGEVDNQCFVPLQAELAMRLGYAPTAHFPLPDGFRWEEKDWWASGGEVALQLETTVVARVWPDEHDFGWKVVTNCHKPWPFRGERIGTSRAAAMQFVSAWAEANARALRREISNDPGDGPAADAVA